MANDVLIEMLASLSLESGTATSLAESQGVILSDSTKSWTADKFKHCIVRIVNGKGTGQLARIIANSADSLQVSPSWIVGLDTTSVYVIYQPEVAGQVDSILHLVETVAGKVNTVEAKIKSLTRLQHAAQTTTNALTAVGEAIESGTPFRVTGWLSLHNMVLGDEFLVVEEIRDQDDTTYREYSRNLYSSAQTSPMIWFNEKVCQGWRVRIQRTGGVDREVTYQFFKESV
jgi:hypothetical protein